MPINISVQSLPPQLVPLINEEGFIELFTRTTKKKFRDCFHVYLDNAQHDKAAEAAVEKLANMDLMKDFDISQLARLANLSQFNLLLQAVNLGATIAGFAIMYSKLNGISDTVENIVKLIKTNESAHLNFEYGKVLSEHRDMLDCRKKQKKYTEQQMRKLVDDEYNVLNLLIATFTNNAATNKMELYQSIIGLAQMLSVSIRHFDEAYYFANKDSIVDGEKWHASHDVWLSVYDKLASKEMIERVQDFGIFELGLNTSANDFLYVNYHEQMKGLKQDIVDNQALIEMSGESEMYDATINAINTDIENKIVSLFQEMEVPPAVYSGPLRVVVA